MTAGPLTPAPLSRSSLHGVAFRLWFALAVGSGFFLPIFLATSLGQIPANSDFITFYTAGSLSAGGQAHDVYLPAALDRAATEITHQPVDGLRWLYPPGMLLVVWPLGFFPLTAAYLLWLTAGAGLLAVSLWWLAPHPLTPLLVLICPAALYCAIVGQISLFAVATMAAGFALVRQRPGSSSL